MKPNQFEQFKALINQIRHSEGQKVLNQIEALQRSAFLMRDNFNEPELPISNRLDPSKVPSSTRAILVLLMNAVNHPIERTKPSVGVVS